MLKVEQVLDMHLFRSHGQMQFALAPGGGLSERPFRKEDFSSTHRYFLEPFVVWIRRSPSRAQDAFAGPQLFVLQASS